MMCSTVRSSLRDAGECGIERCVDEDDAVCAVIDDEGELLGEEADVERVDDRAHRGDGVVGFEVLLGVPAEGADAVAGLDAETLQSAMRGGGRGRQLRGRWRGGRDRPSR